MGEKESEPFQFTFNGFLKVAFQGSRVTSDAGLILVLELDERLGLEAIVAEHLRDSRHGLNTQSRCRISCGNRSTAAWRAMKTSMMRPGSRRIPRSPDRITETVGPECGANLDAALVRDRSVGSRGEPRRADGREPRPLGQAETWDRSDGTVLDMDSSESPVHGQQKAVPTTATSRRCAITRCFCSAIKATAWRRSCGLATFPAPTTGTSCWCRR